MTEPQQGPVSSRFVGVVGLVSSLAFGLVAMSVWLMTVMLATTGVVPLMLVHRMRSRWRVVLSALVTGVVGVVLVYLLRSRGLRIF
jgi:hypothetical protein